MGIRSKEPVKMNEDGYGLFVASPWQSSQEACGDVKAAHVSGSRPTSGVRKRHAAQESSVQSPTEDCVEIPWAKVALMGNLELASFVEELVTKQESQARQVELAEQGRSLSAVWEPDAGAPQGAPAWAFEPTPWGEVPPPAGETFAHLQEGENEGEPGEAQPSSREVPTDEDMIGKMLRKWRPEVMSTTLRELSLPKGEVAPEELELVVRGYDPATVIDLTLEEARAILTGLVPGKLPTVVDARKWVLELLGKESQREVLSPKYLDIEGWAELVPLLAAKDEKGKSSAKLGLKVEVWRKVVRFVVARAAAAKAKRTAEKAQTFEKRLENRAAYQTSGELLHYRKPYLEGTDVNQYRWRWELGVECVGILPRILEFEGCGDTNHFRARAIAYEEIKESFGEAPDDLWSSIPDATGGDFHGFAQTLLLKMEGRTKEYIEAAFPYRVEAGGYVGRLYSPLIPNGFLTAQRVRFSQPQALKKGENGEWVAIPQETDGSGLYDPAHPDAAALVAEYGVVPLQFTLMRKDGLFAKGILVPRNGLNEGLSEQEASAWHLDLAQVKGAKKGKVQPNELGCYIGFMKAFAGLGSYPGNFEMLQMIQTNEKTVEIVKRRVEAELDEMGAGRNGKRSAEAAMENLLNAAVKDDETKALVVSFVRKIRLHDPKFSPMSVPMLKDMVVKALRRKLWKIATGAGIEGQQYVCVLDASVEPGTCVLPGFEPGKRVAIWRYPMVAPQGLIDCLVVEPSPHQMVDGAQVPSTIFLHPTDLTLGMQGDDDGDIVGVTDDPDTLTLFDNKVVAPVNRWFSIEAEGAKVNVPTYSRAGLSYLETDPRGPVGFVTMAQARLYGMGDVHGAIALAPLLQEAIDQAKKTMAYTDPSKALDLKLWENSNKAVQRDGQPALTICKATQFTKQPKGFPFQEVSKFVKRRAKAFGWGDWEPTDDGARWVWWGNPIGWYHQEEISDLGEAIRLKGMIDLRHWSRTVVPASGATETTLVTFCNDTAYELFKAEDGFWSFATKEQEVASNMQGLLAKLLSALGQEVPGLTCETADSYRKAKGLRDVAGITEYGKKYKELSASRLPEEAKQKKVEILNTEFADRLKALSVAELYTVWWWETSNYVSIPQERGAPKLMSAQEAAERGYRNAHKAFNESYAVRAVATEGSALGALLELTEDLSATCPWWSEEKRQKTEQWVFASPTGEIDRKAAFARAARLVNGNESHAQMVRDDDGKPVALRECPHCAKEIADLVVRKLRASKAEQYRAYLVKTMQSLNAVANAHNLEIATEALNEGRITRHQFDKMKSSS